MANHELLSGEPMRMAQDFLDEHDISREEFTSTYIAERVQRIRDGEPTWVVRDVNTDGRAYDMHYLGEVIATITDGIGEFRLGNTFLYFWDHDTDTDKAAVKQAAYDKLEAIRNQYEAGPERKLRQIAAAIESVDEFLDH